MGSSSPLKILIVDDDPFERERCARFLAGDPKADYAILEAESAEAARASIARNAPDCVLLDHSLPDGDGIAFIAELSDAQGRTVLPIVMMTAESDADLAVASIQAGAQDYAVKSRLTAEGLSRSVRNAVEKLALRKELERQQDALAESQRRELEMKEELLSHVSHELRTPLTAVHQFVSILLDEVPGELNPRQKEFLSIIYKNAKQLRDMIGDLMDVARGSAGKLTVAPTITSLGPILEDSVGSLEAHATDKGVELSLEPLPALPRVLADEGRVRQVMTNLVTNAVKFTPEGRRISVRAAMVGEDGEYDQDLCVRVSVTDQGCGIAPESLSRVFERMHQEPHPSQASRRGLGLGLYICQQLIAGHGGRIWAESSLGEGSTFHFTLPVYSLRRLLRPLLSLEEEPDGGCHLVAVEMVLGAVQNAEEADAAFTALRREVEALVHRNRDIVIPRLRVRQRDTGPLAPHAPVREICFVVAHADDAAARAMSSRLGRALRRSEVVSGLDAEIAIRSHAVPLPPRPPEPRVGWLERVALGVRRAMDAELRSSGLIAA